MSEIEQRFSANAQQAEYWNTVAGEKWVRHNVSMDQRLRPMTDELIVRAGVARGHSVLDIGCGGGATTEQIAQVVDSTGHVLGLDISEPMLALARARCAQLAQVSFENADAQVHPFPTQRFDRLISRFGVMFFNDPPAAFNNLRTSLRTSGALHFVCWASADDNPWFSVPLTIAKRHLGAPDPIPPRAPGPLAFSEPDYVREILTAAGFRSVDIESVKTTVASSDSAEQQAALYLEMGPAARLIAAKSPDASTMATIASELVSELKKFETGNGVALGATVHYVAASA